MKLSDWQQQEQVLGLHIPDLTPAGIQKSVSIVERYKKHYYYQKDKTKPHLYFMEGKWHYRSAWLGFDYINGPSEERNNSAMLWCWNQNYNKAFDGSIIFS